MGLKTAHSVKNAERNRSEAIRTAHCQQSHFRVAKLTLTIIILVITLTACDPTLLTTAPSSVQYELGSSTLPVNWTWSFEAEDNIISPVIIDPVSGVYFRTNRLIYAVNPGNGLVQWTREIGTSPDIQPLANALYLYVVEVGEDTLSALNAKTGKLEWKFKPDQWTTSQSTTSRIQMTLLYETTLYVIVNLRRGTDIFALDITTGEIKGSAPASLRESGASPYAFYADQDKVILQTTETWILSAGLEKVIARFKDRPASYRIPTFANNLLLTSGQVINALSVLDNTIKWHFEDECFWPWDQFPESPQIFDDNVYALTTCGLFYKISLHDGTPVWKYRSPIHIVSYTLFGNAVYLMTSRGTVLTVDISSGQMIGTLPVRPALVAQKDYKHLISSERLLIISYGNNQAFAFQSR
jgi:outer membrane protein assembly factor BamB